jgi:hypothetical protein
VIKGNENNVLPRKGPGNPFLGPTQEVPVSPLLGTLKIKEALSILGLLHKNLSMDLLAFEQETAWTGNRTVD